MSALTLECGRDEAEVAQALDAIEAHLLAAGAGMAEALQWRLVAEEIVTNVARCAWPEGHAGRFRVELDAAARADGLRVRMTTIDDGTPFDPTAQAMPALDAAVDDRPIGGLGMFLVKEMTDAQAYAREGGLNRFSVERLLPR